MKLPLKAKPILRTHSVLDSDGRSVAVSSDMHDAIAIVRAVNAMPACIEAMELVLDFLEYVKADLKHRGEAGGHRSKLRAALAAARGSVPSNH